MFANTELGAIDILVPVSKWGIGEGVSKTGKKVSRII